MKNADPGLDLELMIEAAGNARSFVEGLTERDFLSDSKTQHAVAMCLIVIGECAKRLLRNSPAFVKNVNSGRGWTSPTCAIESLTVMKA